MPADRVYVDMSTRDGERYALVDVRAPGHGFGFPTLVLQAGSSTFYLDWPSAVLSGLRFVRHEASR